MAYPVDIDPDAYVLSGPVPLPGSTGTDLDRSGMPRFGSHRYDSAAKLSRGAQRSDKVEIVGGKQRRRNGFSQPPDGPHEGNSRG